MRATALGDCGPDWSPDSESTVSTSEVPGQTPSLASLEYRTTPTLRAAVVRYRRSGQGVLPGEGAVSVRTESDKRGGRVRLTVRDQEIVGWIGRHRLVAAEQVGRRFGLERSVGYRRLAALVAMKLVEHHRVFVGEPGVYVATRAGLGLSGSELSTPFLDVRTYRHDTAVVDVAVDAELRRFATTTEREARHRRLAVELSGGGKRLHFPDLVVEAPGPKTAIEVELTPKRTRRLAEILNAYAWSSSFEAVVYYVPTPRLEELIQRQIERLHLQSIVRVARWNGCRRPSGVGSREAR